eukprot:16429669-Heterocapsa_arctica.AAC.1
MVPPPPSDQKYILRWPTEVPIARGALREGPWGALGRPLILRNHICIGPHNIPNGANTKGTSTKVHFCGSLNLTLDVYSGHV